MRGGFTPGLAGGPPPSVAVLPGSALGTAWLSTPSRSALIEPDDQRRLTSKPGVCRGHVSCAVRDRQLDVKRLRHAVGCGGVGSAHIREGEVRTRARLR